MKEGDVTDYWKTHFHFTIGGDVLVVKSLSINGEVHGLDVPVLVTSGYGWEGGLHEGKPYLLPSPPSPPENSLWDSIRNGDTRDLGPEHDWDDT